ncbi:MAG: hypothetical protein HY270_06105 [Deltaproteobacteria bacterium]|nr:hypothetical protein [Deltaproteobacteria bacterium]
MQRVREMFGDHKREPCPYCGSTEPFHSCSRPPLHAIVHELRDALRAQRDHLEDLTTIVNHLETALTRLPAGGQL